MAVVCKKKKKRCIVYFYVNVYGAKRKELVLYESHGEKKQFLTRTQELACAYRAIHTAICWRVTRPGEELGAALILLFVVRATSYHQTITEKWSDDRQEGYQGG